MTVMLLWLLQLLLLLSLFALLLLLVLLVVAFQMQHRHLVWRGEQAEMPHPALQTLVWAVAPALQRAPGLRGHSHEQLPHEVPAVSVPSAISAV